MYLIEQLRYINGPDNFFFSNQVEIIAYTTKKIITFHVDRSIDRYIESDG